VTSVRREKWEEKSVLVIIFFFIRSFFTSDLVHFDIFYFLLSTCYLLLATEF